jgi:hypothetical protein
MLTSRHHLTYYCVTILQGDWTCPNPQCNDFVFGTSAHCKLCGTSKPNFVLSAEEEHWIDSLQELKEMVDQLEGGLTKETDTPLDIFFLYGARFLTGLCTRGCHWIPRIFA